jgi:glyoxylase-like metal-dependent hydrolase (beta-lactamase superfamily II)
MTDQSRREFLARSGSCAAHLALASLAMPPLLRSRWARVPVGAVVAEEKFARLEQVGPGVWALISTPLNQDFTTVSNGGIIAGKNGVLAIEGFMQPAGAAWLAGKAKELTGRLPTHVVLTHYHSDHANGLGGYVTSGGNPQVHATPATNRLVIERNQLADSTRTGATLGGAIALDGAKETKIDLGGRTVKLVPRAGHTASDVSVELDEPSIVFTGDLVWNAMFPNFVDATPTQLARSVAALTRKRETIYVPGHGAVTRRAELDGYVAMLGEVERAARQAHGAGQTATEAAASYRLPTSLGEWYLFAPAFMERAFEAWYRELGG